MQQEMFVCSQNTYSLVGETPTRLHLGLGSNGNGRGLLYEYLFAEAEFICDHIHNIIPGR